MLEVPGSNPAGSIKIAYFCRNFLFFYFFQKSNFWHKKLPPLKPILALPTWGQICLVSEIHPFEIKNLDLGHPVKQSVRVTVCVRNFQFLRLVYQVNTSWATYIKPFSIRPAQLF